MLNTNIRDLSTDYGLTSLSSVTATGLSAAVNEQDGHDHMTRFLATEDVSQKSSWLMMKPVVRPIEQDDGIIVGDDPIEETPSPDEKESVGWHSDQTTGQTVTGIHLVNVLYQVERPGQSALSVPLADDVVSKPETVVDAATGTTNRTSTVGKNTLVRDRVNIVRFPNQSRFA